MHAQPPLGCLLSLEPPPPAPPPDTHTRSPARQRHALATHAHCTRNTAHREGGDRWERGREGGRERQKRKREGEGVYVRACERGREGEREGGRDGGGERERERGREGGRGREGEKLTLRRSIGYDET
jgi:hypothetical protein